MKLHITLTTLAIGLTLLFASCSKSPEKQTEQVAKDFTEAMAKGDIDLANTFCTETAAHTMSTLNLLGVLPTDVDFEFVFEKAEINETQDSAIIYYTSKTNSEIQRLDLIKNSKGDWKVDIRM